MRHHVGYFVIVLSLFLALLGWIGHVRQHDYHEYHVAIARDSSSIAAVEITRFIEDKQRLVRLFADDHRTLIEAVARSGDDSALYRQLAAKVSAYFPDHFTFAVADAGGELLMDDFDGLVGDLCLSDLREFLGSGEQQTRIHPHPEKYHFDILAPLGKDATQGVFFISFHADILGRVLSAIQSPGHQLILLYPEAGDLIEATADGARINWVRDDYRLSTQERQRILHRETMPGTRWEIVDLHASRLFDEYRATLLGQSALVFAAFVLINLIMLFYLYRAVKSRGIAEAQIRHMAYVDELTGLPNRRMLMERLQAAMSRSARNGDYGALMFIDMDNFKALNDVHGHDMGDLLLKEVARRIRDCLRTEDTVARFGGDEFVVLMEDLGRERTAAEEKVHTVGGKILSALAEPYRLSRRREDGLEQIVEHRCTSSIGAALFLGDAVRLDDMLKWADTAMYQAKETGRNRIRVSEAGLETVPG